MSMNWTHLLLFHFVLLNLIFAPLTVFADFKNLDSQPAAPQNRIKILTLNVMQKASQPRASRFQKIVDFLTGEQVHLLALQELSGGLIDENSTKDSGADLAAMLAEAHVPYGYYTEPAFGYPGLLVFKVGVMSRHKMLFTASSSTGTPTEGARFQGRKNVVMCGLDIPGFGRLNLYSVHIYTPSEEGIEAQIDNLVNFAQGLDAKHPAMASIVAGDLNFPVESHPRAYQKLIHHNFKGFIDSFAALHCPTDPGGCTKIGPTFGVLSNPYARRVKPARIDFVLVRGDKVQISQSRVVFNSPGNFVSDHCGVLTEITR
jgi:endonuclease/exonuclease/phosphatase family metal-dependent hydrolase